MDKEVFMKNKKKIIIVVAAIASFLPVKKIASKKPIDAIRNR